MAKLNRPKIELMPFDTLELIRTAEDGSKWQGARGTYYFKATASVGAKKPDFHLYLNHKFVTGLFSTKKDKIFNGDIRTAEGKTFLLFKFLDSKMEIYTKGNGTGLINAVV